MSAIVSSNVSAQALKCLGDVKMFCVVHLKCVGMILLSYRRDKQMRLGSRASTTSSACCETKRDFRSICCRQCCWPGEHRHSTQANDRNPPPPKLLHIIESSQKPKCIHVWFRSFSILWIRRGVKRKDNIRKAEQFEVTFYNTPSSATGDLTILSPVRHGGRGGG